MLQRVLAGAFRYSAPQVSASVAQFGDHYYRSGAKYLLVVTTLLAAWRSVSWRKVDAYCMAALSSCLFLVMASGFGVLYLGCVVPVLTAVNVATGFGAATATGVFAALIYCTFVTSWIPLITIHKPWPHFFAPASFMAWWVLLGCLIRIGRRCWSPILEHSWPADQAQRADK
jgi:hypothetical protein